jgi:uncharacterized protein
MADDTRSSSAANTANAAYNRGVCILAIRMSADQKPLPILSPCIGTCRLGIDGYCEGCLRTGDEIARWVAMGEAERRRLLDDVLPRREAIRG